MHNATPSPNVKTNVPSNNRLRLTINLISFVAALAISLVLLVLLIGYRDSKIGFLAVGGLGGVALGAAIFFYPEVGAYVLAVTVFSNVSSIFTDAGLPGINKPLVALTFLSIIAGRFARRQPFRVQRTEWLLLAYAGVGLVSTFFATDRIEAIDAFITLAKDVLIAITIIYSVQTVRQFKITIWLIILTTSAVALLGAFQAATGSYGNTFGGFATVTPDVTQMRLSGPVGDPNFWGQILDAVLALALFRFITEKKFWWKLLGGGTFLVLLFVVINSYSRGAFMALGVILLLTIIQQKVNLKKLVAIAAVLVVVIPASLPFLPAGFLERMQTLTAFTGDKSSAVRVDKSFQGRSSEMISGLLMFRDHPILGVGIGNYEINYQDYARKIGLEYRTEIRQAHSLYVEIISETGILGLLAFFALIISLFVRYRQNRRDLTGLEDDWLDWDASLQIATVSYLTTSIFLHGDFFRFLTVLIALGITSGHISHKLWEHHQTEKSGMTVEGAA